MTADVQIIPTNDNWTAFGFSVGMGHIEIVEYHLPFVELREYTLREGNGETMREVVLENVARRPEKPYLDVRNKSYHEKLAEVCSTTGRRIPTKGSKQLKPVYRLDSS